MEENYLQRVTNHIKTLKSTFYLLVLFCINFNYSSFTNLFSRWYSFFILTSTLTTNKYSTPLLDSLRFSYLKLSVKEVLELKVPCDQEEYAFNKDLSD